MSLNFIRETKEKILSAVREKWPDAAVGDCAVEVPNLEAHGDLATNVAMTLAPVLKQPPVRIAETLADALRDDERWRIEVKQPGFLNFFFSHDFLLFNVQRYLSTLTEFPKRTEKIVLEHTNVNPNKAMHIGHLRNAVLGDVINNVLKRVGYRTEVQYYVDDTGAQVADTFVALKEFGDVPAKGQKFDHFCWDRYAQINAAYQKDPHLLEKRSSILHALEDADSTEAGAVKELASRILNDHLSSMADFGVSYDLLVWESDILRFEFWKHAFEVLQRSDSFTKENEGKNKGCWVLKTGETSQDEEHSPDKILVKSDNTVTYTGKDIAYHLWKFDLLGKDFRYGTWKKAPQKKSLATTDTQGKKSSKYGRADRVYNVIDVRQAYPQAMVKLALEKLGYEQESKHLKHVSYGIVKLAGEGKMSGREGRGVKVDDLLRMVTERVSTQAYSVQSKRLDAPISDCDIAVGVIKYFMLRYNPHSEIVFDFKEAGAITGNTGPYIQYAHARASGILAKAGIHSFPKPQTGSLSSAEARLVKRLYRWVAVLESVSETLNVNEITQYAFELANSFNSFYEAHLVLKAEEPDRSRRLALVYAFRSVVADVLGTLGIVAPDAM